MSPSLPTRTNQTQKTVYTVHIMWQIRTSESVYVQKSAWKVPQEHFLCARIVFTFDPRWRRACAGAKVRTPCRRWKSRQNIPVPNIQASPLGGHCGVETTHSAIINRDYWPGMEDDIYKWVSWYLQNNEVECTFRFNSGAQRGGMCSFGEEENMSVHITLN